MIVRRDLIDLVAPKHDRTSCSDDNWANDFYQIQEEKLQGVVISRRLEGPDCVRCFLLCYEDRELPDHLELKASVEVIQPKFRVIAEE